MSQFSPAGKPAPLRAMFIMNAVLMFLPFVFYAVSVSTGRTIAGIPSEQMLYVGAAYIASFALQVFFILRRNLTGLRIMYGVTLLASLPLKAFIGIVVALVATGLSFHKRVRAWFGAPSVVA